MCQSNETTAIFIVASLIVLAILKKLFGHPHATTIRTDNPKVKLRIVPCSDLGDYSCYTWTELHVTWTYGLFWSKIQFSKANDRKTGLDNTADLVSEKQARKLIRKYKLTKAANCKTNF